MRKTLLLEKVLGIVGPRYNEDVYKALCIQHPSIRPTPDVWQSKLDKANTFKKCWALYDEVRDDEPRRERLLEKINLLLQDGFDTAKTIKDWNRLFGNTKPGSPQSLFCIRAIAKLLKKGESYE